MKFLKLSILIVLVTIVAIFIYCDSGPQDKEQEGLRPEWDPLTQAERAKARRNVVYQILKSHEDISDLFNNSTASNRWKKMERIYSKIVKNGGTVKITTQEGEIIGAQRITDHWKSLWDEDNGRKMYITFEGVEISDIEEVINIPVSPDREDMIAVESTLIKIITPEKNQITDGENEWRHKRSCEWID